MARERGLRLCLSTNRGSWIRATGAHTPTDAGLIPKPVGPGFPTNLSAGPVITTDAGRACAMSAGFGFRARNGRPAWVSWRTSDQHVGWAPLPPEARFEKRSGIQNWADSYYDIDAGEYVFVPNEEMGDENVQGAVLPPERNVTIVNETVNVTNIVYTNTIIVNHGPDFDFLRGRSRRPIDRLRLQREYGLDQPSARAVVRGDVVRMAAPPFTARAVEKPHISASPIQRGAVEHIRPPGDAAALERARQKMKAEATPPPDAPAKKFEKPVMAEAPPAPVATATPANALVPRPVSAVPLSPATGEPKPVQVEGPDRNAIKLDEQRRREEAHQKLLRAVPNAPADASPSTNAAPRRSAPPVQPPVMQTPVPTETPRRIQPTPPPRTRQLPADMTEGTPSGIELTPPPKKAPRPPPPRATPTPAP